MTTTPAFRSLLPATCVAGLAAASLVATGRSLPLPPDPDPSELRSWLSEAGPVVATFTGLRAVGMALLAWMALTAAAGVVARRFRLVATTTALDRISLPIVRRFANGVAGAALVAASLTGTGPAGAQEAPSPTVPPVVTMQDLGPAPGAPDSPDLPSTTTVAPPTTVASPTTPPPPLTDPDDPAPTSTVAPPTTTVPVPPTTVEPPTPLPTPTMVRPVPEQPPVTMRALGPTPTTTTPTPPPADPPLVTMHPVDPAPPGPAASKVHRWIIEPGDTLWHVAEHVVSERDGRPADPATTLAELHRLVAANADRLVVPGNPDLVYPGQEFRLL